MEGALQAWLRRRRAREGKAPLLGGNSVKLPGDKEEEYGSTLTWTPCPTARGILSNLIGRNTERATGTDDPDMRLQTVVQASNPHSRGTELHSRMFVE